jgi:hypothetical protein
MNWIKNLYNYSAITLKGSDKKSREEDVESQHSQGLLTFDRALAIFRILVDGAGMC